MCEISQWEKRILRTDLEWFSIQTAARMHWTEILVQERDASKHLFLFEARTWKCLDGYFILIN